MSLAESKSPRGADRRERILGAAADLMAASGYPAVSMAQIGAAAGIVGSGVYRHFDSKATILVVLLGQVIDAMLVGTKEIVAENEPGPELLDAMIRRQTEIVIENRSLVAVYLRDAGNLPPEELRRTRRQQRQVVEEWIFACEAVAPTKGEAELRTVAQAVIALINSLCTYDNLLPDDKLAEVISGMASAALTAGLSK